MMWLFVSRTVELPILTDEPGDETSDTLHISGPSVMAGVFGTCSMPNEPHEPAPETEDVSSTHQSDAQ